MINVTFSEFNIDFLHKTYQWLQDPEIRKLTEAPSITKEDQKVWFDTLKSRKDYLIWGVKYNSLMVGVVGLKKIRYKESTAEYFGYVGEKEYWGRGIGSEMVGYAIRMAKENSIDMLTLTVAKYNQRAIHLYKKFGFRQCGGWKLRL